jgi:hypothetical protein
VRGLLGDGVHAVSGGPPAWLCACDPYDPEDSHVVHLFGLSALSDSIGKRFYVSCCSLGFIQQAVHAKYWTLFIQQVVHAKYWMLDEATNWRSTKTLRRAPCASPTRRPIWYTDMDDRGAYDHC